MDTLVRAARARAILDDEVFKDAIDGLKKDQIDIFLSSASELDQIAEARLQVRAIEALRDRLKSVVNDGQILERKINKKN